MPTVKPWLAEGYQASGWGRVKTKCTKSGPTPFAGTATERLRTNLVSDGVFQSLEAEKRSSCWLSESGIRTRLVRLVCPDRISIERLGTPPSSARNVINASLASPSMGLALMAILGSPSCKPTTRDCLAPGWM